MSASAVATEPTAPLPLPPGPPRWPLVGNLPAVRKEGILSFLERNWHQYGDIFRVNMGFDVVVVSHPDGIKRVLAGNAKNYVKGKTYDGVRRVIGNGLLALEGDAWKARRTLVQPAFHRAGLSKLTAAMVDSGQRHFDALLAKHGKSAFRLDAHRDMVELTLDVVVAALFGRELTGAAQVSYEALGASLELVSEQGNGVVLPKWVPTPGNRKFHRTMEEVEGAIYRVIDAGRRSGAGEGTLLSMLLNSRDATTGEPLTDRDLRDEIFTMFVAGHETTALTMTWLFTLLVGRDDVLDRMRAEVDTVLGDRDPQFEDYPKLTYLRQVIDEALRLRGPVAMNARSAVADDELLGHRVKAGDVVMPFFYAAHRHEAFWEEPAKFDPDRFSAERSQGRDSWSYVPFAAGQRQCIGNTFSLVETVVLLAQLLRRFEVKVDADLDQVKPVAVVTVRPDRPVMITLQAR
jgi:cytochrome P450